MKFYKISQILKLKNRRINHLSHNNLYGNLFKDYTSQNSKKEHKSQSKICPFFPLSSQSGYTTFIPNNYYTYAPNTRRFNSCKKNGNPINQKLSQFHPSFKRMTVTEGLNYRLCNNYFKDNDDNDIEKNNYDESENYVLKIGKSRYKKIPKRNEDKVDYRFFSPLYNTKTKNKNIYSKMKSDINSQISEYLNNFQQNKKRMNLLYQEKYNKTNEFTYNSELNTNRRNSSILNVVKGTKCNNTFKGNTDNPHKVEVKANLFNKKNKANIYNNLHYTHQRLTLNKNNKNSNKIPIKHNDRKIYSESKECIFSFNKGDNNIKNKTKNSSKKNSNGSLNPSSLGMDNMRTFYTNKVKNSNNGEKVTSNVNSESSRIIETQYNGLNGLKMASGEINEYFYDFNFDKRKSDTHQTLQSLSDSKMLELANHYLSEEEDSMENYQMNNIIFNKKSKN